MVTGANSGIGKCTAMALAKKGEHRCMYVQLIHLYWNVAYAEGLVSHGQTLLSVRVEFGHVRLPMVLFMTTATDWWGNSHRGLRSHSSQNYAAQLLTFQQVQLTVALLNNIMYVIQTKVIVCVYFPLPWQEPQCTSCVVTLSEGSRQNKTLCLKVEMM